MFGDYLKPLVQQLLMTSKLHVPLNLTLNRNFRFLLDVVLEAQQILPILICHD